MSTVSLRHIKKVYDNNVTAVHDFNLEIADKEFIVLVGPSGCGKSTTLRMVAGLEEISGGELYIDDKLVNNIEPKDRDIAMVFQSYALYPHMTVEENMAFSLKIKKIPKEEINRKVQEAAKILGITEYLKRKPKALSGGQRQRVAIGRAIVREPKVFLMDEPLSNLDAKLRNQMRAEIIKLRQRIDTTFIYVTHDQTEAMTLGDRIVIMKDGHIMQIGTPQEVFEKPKNLFVAGFIGTPQMNFFDGELVKAGEGRALQVTGGAAARALPPEGQQAEDGKLPAQPQEPDIATMELSPEIQAALAKNAVPAGPVTAGIRPEHITFVRKAGEHTLTGTVEVSEMMGSEYHLHAATNGKDVVFRVPITDLPPERRGGIPYGETVHYTFRPESIHLFNPETEDSLLL
ncbi:MAG: sn-glycerol-3-phosphate ABC transporter ATP-binding protein UgpC [Oscillospiraceae bacterium]|nr:sn-glycerol-3-phosphate ABC transporter ATP-binding protein UgpC [Oscillospiraceae bacterium]